MRDEEAGPQSRRAFFFWLLGGIGAVLGAAVGWMGLRFLAPATDRGGETRVELAVAEVPVGSARFFELRGRPAVLLQHRPGEFVALSAVCTHLGCVVKWDQKQDRFVCPCHGGTFSAQGAVLGGPPPAPLSSLPVSRIGDRLLIG